MRLSSLLLSMFVTFSAYAEPACVITKNCMEYNGSVIDLRSPIQQMIDKSNGCDLNTGRCLNGMNTVSMYPKLSSKEFQKLTAHSTDKKYFIPLDIKNKDQLLLLSSLSLGVVLFANDKEIMNFVQSNKTATTRKVETIGNLLGREAIVPIVAGTYFIGAVMKDDKLQQVGLFALSTGLATQLVTEVFKKSFQRVRPNGSDSPYEFGQSGHNSFFSGHSSGAFSLATVIAEVYKDQPLIPYLSYGMATLTTYARMHDKKHWASDVLMGAVAGHLVTKILMRTWENRKKSGGLIVTPVVGSEQMGISVSYTPQRPLSPKLRCEESHGHAKDILKECFDEIFARAAN